MQKEAVVVIPVYRQLTDKFEQASFCQCLKVLGSHDIAIVTHEELNCGEYVKIAERYGVTLQIHFFDKFFFQGIDGYNRLCLSKDFYTHFENYQYMLVFQLDAWVFRDELQYWCEKGYDYIGAPWPHLGNNVGNGGFSLRKISHFLKICNGSRHKMFSNRYVWTRIDWTSPKSIVMTILKSFGFHNTCGFFLDSWKHLPEDVIYGYKMKGSFFEAKVPDWKEALSFSVEDVTSLGDVQLTKNTLPFGTHAYYRFGRWDFWKQYITID